MQIPNNNNNKRTMCQSRVRLLIHSNIKSETETVDSGPESWTRICIWSNEQNERWHLLFLIYYLTTATSGSSFKCVCPNHKLYLTKSIYYRWFRWIVHPKKCFIWSICPVIALVGQHKFDTFLMCKNCALSPILPKTTLYGACCSKKV